MPQISSRLARFRRYAGHCAPRALAGCGKGTWLDREAVEVDAMWSDPAILQRPDTRIAENATVKRKIIAASLAEPAVSIHGRGPEDRRRAADGSKRLLDAPICDLQETAMTQDP